MQTINYTNHIILNIQKAFPTGGLPAGLAGLEEAA
jgi:hypothetical protein